ncbi:MAG: hypothetical protein IJO43_03430 [Bacilli bacterium]|nr:hypothetical protein [Bacilli bacterium]
MEIRFENVFYKNKLENINLKLNNDKINGIYNYNSFIKLMNNPKLLEKGNIFIDDKVYKNFDPKIISIVDKDKGFYTSKVIDEIYFYSKIRNYKSTTIKQDIICWLKEFGLDESILKRIPHSLSQTEKYFIKIICNLIYKPKIIIFKDIMNGMDYNNRKLIKKIINKLNEEGILIIVTSMDSNILYDLTEELFIFDRKKLLISGNTNDIYTDIEKLNNSKVDIPVFSRLTYKANKEKGVNLFYRKDVRDVIKDVYKNV